MRPLAPSAIIIPEAERVGGHVFPEFSRKELEKNQCRSGSIRGKEKMSELSSEHRHHGMNANKARPVAIPNFLGDFRRPGVQTLD
jgi:hypothetical protein